MIFYKKETEKNWVSVQTWKTLHFYLFFRVLNEKEHEAAGRNEHNFDNPEAFDFPLLKETLQRLKEGKKVDVPIYNFVTHRREEKSTSMYGANVLIFEGILAFHDTAVREILGEQRYFDSTDGHKLITFSAIIFIHTTQQFVYCRHEGFRWHWRWHSVVPPA